MLPLKIAWFDYEFNNTINFMFIKKFTLKYPSKYYNYWQIRVFSEFGHFEDCIQEWVPDIIISHSHGDSSVSRNRPKEILTDIKKKEQKNIC